MTLAWLILAVLVAPLAAFPANLGIGIPQAKNAVVILAGLLGVVLVLPRNPWLWGFMLWSLVPFVASGMRGWGMAGLLGLLAWGLLYGAASRLPSRDWGRLRYGLAAAAVFQAGWMGLQALGLDPLFRPLSYQGEVLSGPVGVMGWFANPMDTALFLSVSLPAVWMVAPVAAALLLPVILSLRASIGLACVAILAGWLAWPRGWGVRLGTLAGIALGAWAYVRWVDPAGFGRRWPIWLNAWSLGWQSPWVGWGPNAIGYSLLVYLGGEHWDFVFNEWLQGFVEFGLVGVALAAGYLGRLLWRLQGRWMAVEEALPVLGMLLVASIISIPFRIGPVALLSALYLGRLEGHLAEVQA